MKNDMAGLSSGDMKHTAILLQSLSPKQIEMIALRNAARIMPFYSIYSKDFNVIYAWKDHMLSLFKVILCMRAVGDGKYIKNIAIDLMNTSNNVSAFLSGAELQTFQSISNCIIGSVNVIGGNKVSSLVSSFGSAISLNRNYFPDRTEIMSFIERDIAHANSKNKDIENELWSEIPNWLFSDLSQIKKYLSSIDGFEAWSVIYSEFAGIGVGNKLFTKEVTELLLSKGVNFWRVSDQRPASKIMREICDSVGLGAQNSEAISSSISAPKDNDFILGQSLLSDDSNLTPADLKPEQVPQQNSYDPEPKASEKRSSQVFSDQADIQHDNPTLKDELGRSPFVEVMVDRLQSLHADQLKRGQGFAINLHAPWGAGKSTILKMMEARLTTDRRFKDRWIVVNFNAWENERRRPPWWAMLEAVYRGICDGLGFNWRAGLIFARWARFNFMGNVFPVLVAIGVAAACTYLVWTLGLENNAGKVITSVITALVTLAGTGFLVARGLVFGSKQYAEQHEVMTRDTLGRVRKLFKSLIDITDRPLCIMIDDLDRCDADYLVELLEGIQTAFRHPNVVYVVAADRKWIKSAFEHRYNDAFAQVEGMGQPLGYLFLEKIFQLSTPLPAPSHNAQRRYWQKLLGEDGEAQSLSPQPTAEDLRQLRQQAESRIETADTYEEIEAIVEQSEASEDSEALQDEIRSAAFERASRSETIEREAKHRLAQLSTIIPFNPRNMKRLLNTYTLRVGEGFSGGVKPEVLARWVVLEHSYPELTDLLAEQPDLARHFQEEADKLEGLPPLVQQCRDRKQVSEIFWKTVEGVSAPLTVEDVRKLTRSMV